MDTFTPHTPDRSMPLPPFAWQDGKLINTDTNTPITDLATVRRCLRASRITTPDGAVGYRLPALPRARPSDVSQRLDDLFFAQLLGEPFNSGDTP